MLKVAIENSYINTYRWKDEYGARYLMQEFFKENDIELVRVSMNKLNKKNEFIEYNILWKNGKNKVIRKIYKPDIIRSRRGMWNYFKYVTFEKDYLITPSEKISIISNDKYETYLFCQKFQPRTLLLKTFFSQENKDTLWEKIIIKPIRANGGNWIKLTTPQMLYEEKEHFSWLEELYIVQEFKDFSGWYPWITEGTHDVRLMFAGENIIETTLRIPAEWNFKSNLWSWWTQCPLKKRNLPKELITLAKKIYKEIQLTGDDILSMDFAYCKGENKWYLIEINASPGTRYYQTDKNELISICKWLVGFFKRLK